MNQKQFTKLLAGKINLPVKKTKKLVEAFGNSIESALKNGERVVYSNFGSFYLVNYPSKVINHPIFGRKKRTVMLPTNAVKWMPSDNIKDLVDNHLKTQSVTSFGSSKSTRAAKENAGISGGKAVEISEAEFAALVGLKKQKSAKPDHSSAGESSEVVEIPIRIVRKSWLDRPAPQIQSAEKEIIPFVKDKVQIKFIDLSMTEIPDAILCLVPEEIARKTKVVPVDLKDEILILGMTDPHDHDSLALIKKLVRRSISPRLISESDFDNIFSQYRRLALNPTPISLNPPTTPKSLSFTPSTPISRVINLILKRAVRDRAKAIYFDPTDRGVTVSFRVEGQLLPKATLNATLQKAAAARLKHLAGLTESVVANHDKFFSVNIDDRREDFELISVPVVNGEKIIIKMVDRLKTLEKLTELDLATANYQKIIDNAGMAGITLVAAPGEKERGRIFYALADLFLSRGLNIVTLEHNPALIIPGLSQIDLADKNALDFASFLRSVSKIDCDVLMMDRLPTKAAFDTIFTYFDGKVIVITIEAKDSFDALDQVRQSGIDSQLIAGELNLIIAGKTVNKICPICRTSQKLDAETIRRVRKLMKELPSEDKARLRKFGSHFYRSDGCDQCGQTGYLGQVSLAEVLLPNKKIRRLIGGNAKIEHIEKEANHDNFISLDQDGIIKALLGETTVAEVLK